MGTGITLRQSFQRARFRCRRIESTERLAPAVCVAVRLSRGPARAAGGARLAAPRRGGVRRRRASGAFGSARWRGAAPAAAARVHVAAWTRALPLRRGDPRTARRAHAPLGGRAGAPPPLPRVRALKDRYCLDSCKLEAGLSQESVLYAACRCERSCAR
eukprot:6208238-Pleurochrysis_carterae.AAC.2